MTDNYIKMMFLTDSDNTGIRTRLSLSLHILLAIHWRTTWIYTWLSW